ncbi:kelch repeat and BTB domain-containing protein 2-like [Branchiostoma floridae x Branchiostoma belcheri]
MDVTNKEYPKDVLRGLNELRERAELTDVVLEVEGRSFPCHRAVLASCSQYFRRMFTSGYAESKQDRITIQDVSGVAMATILDYAYTGCLQTEPDQVQAVMSAARLLQVEFVCSQAAEYMKKHLDMSNCADVLMYADMLGDLDLQETSVMYMASRFNQVVLQPSFLQLSLPLLQSLLNRDDLMAKSEDDIVQAALRWIEFNKEDRLQHLPALCKSFRRAFISAKQREELQSKCPSSDCPLVYSDRKTKRLGQTQTEMPIILGNYFFEFSKDRNAVCYDPLKRKSYVMNMPDDLGSYSLAVTPTDDLYLAGCVRVANRGKDKDKAFFQFNHQKNAWESRCDLISPRISCGLVHLKGYIYAIGGDKKNKTAERYDPSRDEWTSIPPIPYPMPVQPTAHPDPNWSSVLRAVALDDSVYVITSKGCYRFNTTENTWSKTADMLAPPQHPQAVTFHGSIYCVDRRSRSPFHVQMYDPKDNVWKHSGNGMSFNCSDLILMPHSGSLYLLTLHSKGKQDIVNKYGQTVKRFSEINVLKYQPETDTWLKPEGKVMKFDPMWFQSAHRKDCLVARVVPKRLGYIEVTDEEDEWEDFEERDEDDLYWEYDDEEYSSDYEECWEEDDSDES